MPNATVSQMETQRILEALKAQLKKQKKNYRELAQHLRLSVPSIKRAMNSTQLPLERVVQICDFLGLSLFDLLAVVRREATRGFRFTPDQEAFFAAHPHFLAYLYELRKLSPMEIEQKHRISRKSTFSYLKKLEHMELVELHPGDVVKSKFGSTVVYWDDHGVLGQTLSKAMVLRFARHAADKIAAPGKLFLDLKGMQLTVEQYAELQRECRDLTQKYSEMSALNRKIEGGPSLLYISSMVAMDQWEDPTFWEVKEIGAVKL